jgi:hypothetical protein
MTEAQTLLCIHLAELGFVGRPEYQFCLGRKFRFDVAVAERGWAFECDGHFQGKHGVGWGQGHEKMNLAQAMGWKVFCFHNKDVLTGKAKAFIEKELMSRLAGCNAQERASS